MERIMAPKLQQFRQYQKGGWIALCTLALLISITPIAEAGYNPPPRPSAPKRGTTTPTGVRGGCGSETKTPLTALAPARHIGHTTSTHPSVAWFVPDQKSYPIELTLFEESEKGRGKPIYTTQLQSAFGVMTFFLPPDQPGLKTGKQYVWQIALICNPNRPSKDRWIETLVEVAPTPSDLQAKLATTSDPLKRAELYAEAGFWYDALAETAKVPEAKALLISLLNTLSQMEVPEQKSRLAAIASLLEQRP